MKKQIFTLFFITLSLAALPMLAMEEPLTKKQKKSQPLKLNIILKNYITQGKETLSKEKPACDIEPTSAIEYLEKQTYDMLDAINDNKYQECSSVDPEIESINTLFGSETIEIVIDDPTEIALLSESEIIKDCINNSKENEVVIIPLLSISHHLFTTILTYLKSENTDLEILNNTYFIEILKAAYHIKFHKITATYITYIANKIIRKENITEEFINLLLGLPLELQNSIVKKIKTILLDRSFSSPFQRITVPDLISGKIKGLALSPNNDLLIIPFLRKLCVYDIRNLNNLIRQEDLTDHNHPNSIAFNHTGNLLATTANNRTINIHTFQGRNNIGLRKFANDLDKNILDHHFTSLAFNPNDTILVAGSNYGSLFFYDLTASKKTVIRHINEGQKIHSVALTSKLLATSRGNNTVRIYKLDNPIAILTELPATATPIIAFRPDGNLLAIAINNIIYLYDTATDNITLKKEIHAWQRNFSAIAFSPDSQLMAVSSNVDGTILVFDIQNSSLIKTIHNHTGPVLSVAFNSYFMVTKGSDDNIFIYDLRSMQNIMHINSLEEALHMAAYKNNNNTNNNNNNL